MPGEKEEPEMGAYTPDPNYLFTEEEMWAPLPKQREVVDVTPEIARNWLDTRAHPDVAHNRKASKRTVENYALQMAMGQWRETPQGIAFTAEERDADGKLIPGTGTLVDGQHRLRAITLAQFYVTGAHQVNSPTPDQIQMIKAWPTGKVVIPVDVSPGWSRDIFSYLDVGLRRGAHQLYRHPQATMITSAARYLVPGKIGTYQKGLPLASVLDLAHSWGELETRALDVQQANHKAKIPGAAHLAVMAQAERTEYRDRIDDWLTAINTGFNIPDGDARGLLREKFMQRDKVFNANREAVYNTIVKAWNRYVTNDRRATLSWRFNEGTQGVLGIEEDRVQ